MNDEEILALLPDAVREHPLLDEAAWIELRDSGMEPLEATEMVTTLAARGGFLYGAWLLDKSVKNGGLLAQLKPQMLRVVDVLAAGKSRAAVIEPRRSAKTTTLWCILLGRCHLDEMHMAGFTLALTQKKTAERYRIDVHGPITRKWPDPDTRPVKVYKGNGTERVEFTNGSLLAILSPDGEAFRSGAYDTLLVDEGGAASIEMGDDLKSSVLPSFDTRPDGQFIVSGTAAKFRKGNILWDTLTNPRAAVVRFTVPDGIDPEELESWEPTDESPRGHVRELIEAMHPGLDSELTTLDKMQENFEDLNRDQFILEYLGLFGMEGSDVGLIPPPQFEAALLHEPMPSPPKTFTMAVAVHPDRLWSCIAVAWKRPDGHVLVGVLHHQSGVQGLANKLLGYARKYKVGIIYDTGSTAAAVEMEALTRATPRPKLFPMVTADVRRAATKLLKRLEEGTLHHYGQAQLNGAAEIAVKRAIGNAGGFGFGRPKAQPGADITAVEAVSLALHQLDDERPAQKTEIIFAH